MQVRTPITVITGSLGSGKTTLLRHILDSIPQKIAVLMNEFGEIAIDSKVIQGKNMAMVDLGGGCVCCSLLGEFEAAVDEIIETVHPDVIVVETTGVAEPDALVFDIQDLTKVRLDGVVTVVDADAMVKYPSIGHTTRIQIEAADTILLNKVDLVSKEQLQAIATKLHSYNEVAEVLHTQRCQVDPDLLFGIAKQRTYSEPHHVHQPEFDSFSYTSTAIFKRDCFENFADSLTEVDVYRAKGFIKFDDATYLFNFVAGRWELELFEQAATKLVFIGRQIRDRQEKILQQLKLCE